MFVLRIQCVSKKKKMALPYRPYWLSDVEDRGGVAGIATSLNNRTGRRNGLCRTSAESLYHGCHGSDNIFDFPASRKQLNPPPLHLG